MKSWDFWYGLTLKYKETFGNANTPSDYKTPDGFNLGNWQIQQRQSYNKGKLNIERVKRLEAIGFTWRLKSTPFERVYQETLRYKEQFGNVDAPITYKTPEGYPLGIQQADLRKRYKEGDLHNIEIRLLKNIGFSFAFEEGLLATLRYKWQFGDANAPITYKTSEGYPLGIWQAELRKNYKAGKLDNIKIQELEKAGMQLQIKYDDAVNAILEGFRATLRYKEQFGDANAPEEYITPEGFNLGQWQQAQRIAFKKYKRHGPMQKKIRLLEQVGFKW